MWATHRRVHFGVLISLYTLGMVEGTMERVEPIRIQDHPLLLRLQAGGEGVEKEYELERRFLPARQPSPEELVKMDEREIEQAYVTTVDEHGKLHTTRLRRTFHKGAEGHKLRIAEKKPIKHTRAKLEYQIKLSPDDEFAREFELLWQQRDREFAITPKTRKYELVPVQYTDLKTREMKDGTCEIHHDTHHAEIEGLGRIEVEYKGGDPDALEAYITAQGHRNFLPDWLGKDISDEDWFGGKNIARSLALIQKGDFSPEKVQKLLAEMERQKSLR